MPLVNVVSEDLVDMSSFDIPKCLVAFPCSHVLISSSNTVLKSLIGSIQLLLIHSQDQISVSLVHSVLSFLFLEFLVSRGFDFLKSTNDF